MAGANVNPYLRTRILTAGPQELRLMLYDGAIRFARQGQEALRRKDFEASYNAMSRAKKIVLELSTSLNHKIAPELCERLSSLYTYIYKQLVECGLQKNPDLAEEPIQLLQFERETWEIMMRQGGNAEESSATDGDSVDPRKEPDQTAIAGDPISTSGAAAGSRMAGHLPSHAASMTAGRINSQSRLSASA
ncbi:MAG: flagellar export chaperone FliS [Phycisphaeraceae bacterium]|nr:flagellar export chaperone FliS [Phycisphaeraceae bacterium]